MALQAKTGSFSTGTGSIGSTVVVNDVGFQPKVVLFWWCGRSESSDTLGRATTYKGYGACTSTSNRGCIGAKSVDSVATINGGRYQSDVICVVAADTSTTLGQLDVQSIDSGGFTMVVDEQFSSDLRVDYLALGGESITNVLTGFFDQPASPGNFDITAVGFQPDLVITGAVSLASVPGSSGNRGHFGIGAFDGSGNQAVYAGGEGPEGNVTSQSKSYCYDGNSYAILNDTPTGAIYRGNYVSMLSNGFRLNAIATASGYKVFYVAIKGGNFTVGDFTTRTDGTNFSVSGLGYKPSAVFLFSHGKAVDTDNTVSADDRYSFGAFTSATARVTAAMVDVDNQADMTIYTAIDYDSAYVNIKTDGTEDGALDAVSMDSGGFTMVMDNPDPSSAFVAYIAFGPSVSSTTLTVSDSYSTSQTDVIVVVHKIPQHVRPSQDVTDGNWLNELGTNTNLYDSINEVSYSDSDYIISEVNPSSSPVVVKLQTGNDPASSTGHYVRYRYCKVGADTRSLTVQLRQGYVNESSMGTQIAEWTHSNISATLTTVEQTLTGTQADSITDYSSLFLRFVAG